MVCTLDWSVANITAPYGPGGWGGAEEKKTLVLKSDTALFLVLGCTEGEHWL